MKVAGPTAVFTNRHFQDLEQRQVEFLRPRDHKAPASSDLLEISMQAKNAYLSASPAVAAQSPEIIMQDALDVQGLVAPQHYAIGAQRLETSKQDAVRMALPSLEVNKLDTREPQEITIEHKCLVLVLSKLLSIRIKVPDELQAHPKLRPLNQQEVGSSLPSAYHYKEWSETGRIYFKATGELKTGDGLTVQIAAELNTDRDFVRSYGINLGAGDTRLVDPLVIHCDAPAGALRSTTFVFETRSDGTLVGSIRVGNKTAPLLELGPGHAQPKEHQSETG